LIQKITTHKNLAEHHLLMLKDSGISEEVIAQRGYHTAHQAEDLSRLGFNLKQQALIPALVIPIRDISGEVVLHRIRPDHPRPNPEREGKFFKYESPARARNVLDVPVFSFEHLADTDRPLWFVEGEKKADAIVSQGEVAIALLGVWAWKRNGLPLPEFDRIPMIGREVRVVFDSDAKENVQVRRALGALGHYLKGRVGDA
jgi:hypothetical protein